MSELRDLRVPGLGLAPMKAMDIDDVRHAEALTRAFVPSRARQPSALLTRLRVAMRLVRWSPRRTASVAGAQRHPRVTLGPVPR